MTAGRDPRSWGPAGYCLEEDTGAQRVELTCAVSRQGLGYLRVLRKTCDLGSPCCTQTGGRGLHWLREAELEVGPQL